MDETQILELPIDGILDLHTFSPKDVPSVVRDYLEACAEKGIRDVRIIHGKGKGVLRRTVHAVLDRTPGVESYGLDSGPGSWGVTLVRLAAGTGPEGGDS